MIGMDYVDNIWNYIITAFITMIIIIYKIITVTIMMNIVYDYYCDL